VPGIDPTAARIEGLRAAAAITAGHRKCCCPDSAGHVINMAGRFSDWLLERAASVTLVPAAFTFRQGPPAPGVPTRIANSGGTMSVSLTDAEKFTYTVEPEDSRGFQVADTLTWSEDSGGAVITLTPSDDGLSADVAAVAPGTANVTVTDGTLSGTDVVTVTTGPVAQIVLTPGPVSEQ